MSTVRVDREEQVWTVTIDRPEVRNAVDGPTARALVEAFRAFDADADARVAILTGAGGHFCAGADLRTVARGARRGLGAGGDALSLALDADMDRDGPMGPSRLQLTKPVIAAVEGYAVAGGIELALWCDLRVAAASATFGVFCRRFGVPLIDGGTVRLPRLIGESRAMDLILTGRAVGADEALALGLANRVVDGRPGARRGARARPPDRRLSAALPAQRPAERAPPARPAAARRARAGVRARPRHARVRARPPAAARSASSPAPASTAVSTPACTRALRRHVRKRRVSGEARHNRVHDDRWRCRLPGASRARCALRRQAVRRRDVDGHLLPADLPRADAGAAQLPLLRLAGAGRGRGVPPVPEVPAGDRARAGPALDGDGRLAHPRRPGGGGARRERGERRDAERRRARGPARRERPAPAPDLLRRAWRDAAAVPADAPPAPRQAAPHRHEDADRAGRADERLQEPAPLQRGVRRRLPDEPDAAAAHGEGRRHRRGGGGAGERGSADHGDARLSPAARRGGAARLPRAAGDPRHRGRRRRCRSAGRCAPARSTAPTRAGWLEARFVPEASRVRLSFAPALGAGERRASSPRCGAGSTSTPRPRRSTPRSPSCPARPGCACPAASTASSSRCAPCSASRSRSPARARSPAASSSASAATSRRRGTTCDRAFPAPASARRRADRADRRARHHPQPRRRDPGARAALADARARCSRAAPIRSAWSSGCASCPASARGPRTTSRCAPSAGPTPSRPATSPR